jgi:hypothetical protein
MGGSTSYRVPEYFPPVLSGSGVSGATCCGEPPMDDARFFNQQADWCYQLAWQCFDLAVVHKLNVMGNEHIAKAREQEPTIG